jgi:DNA repair protein RecN (Recombination protein N)
MLLQLHIQNYALIRELDVSLHAGLTVITGETGAGKSILLGALGLVLGRRADSRVLFDPGSKCVVEARFGLEGYGLEEFFAAADLDWEAETSIRREISAAGKSRAFINDTPVNLALLEELGSRLVHIHSQHETLDLNRSRFQTGVLDTLAGNDEHLERYRAVYQRWKELESELIARREARDKALAERDYLQFQFDELQAARLEGVDEQTLEAELRAQEHAADVKRGLEEASGWLSGEQHTAAHALRQASAALRPLLRWREDLQPLQERLESLRLEVQDLGEELERVGMETDWDEERIAGLRESLDSLNRLLHKHRLQRASELLDLRDQLDQKLQDQDRMGQDLEALELACREAEASVSEQADALSQRRAKAAPNLQKSVGKLLAEVGMPHARLLAELHPLEQPGPMGRDQVQFLFSANKGSQPEELRQVASGGELSRLMLCIKSCIARRKAMPTLIFDEIDTGVSGAIGRRIGTLMEELARGHQVLSITHLPQIAACGNRHLWVYKQEQGNKTLSSMRELKGEERVEHIARMISGEQVSEAARANARELLEQA